MSTNNAIYVIAALALAAVALIVAVAINAGPIALVDNLLVRAGEVLAGMFVLALFIERTSAVLVSFWRRHAVDEKERSYAMKRRERRSLQRRIADARASENALVALVPSDPAQRNVALEKAAESRQSRIGDLQTREEAAATAANTEADALAIEDDKTARAKQLVGLVIAILVAAAGVRAVFALAPAPADMADPGAWIYRLADIVITAGLLAGGSAGIGQLTELLQKFIRSSEANADTTP